MLEVVTTAVDVMVAAEDALLVQQNKLGMLNFWLPFTADLWQSDCIWDLMALTPIVQRLKIFLHTLQNPPPGFPSTGCSQVPNSSSSNHLCWNFHFPICRTFEILLSFFIPSIHLLRCYPNIRFHGNCALAGHSYPTKWFCTFMATIYMFYDYNYFMFTYSKINQ